MLGGKNNAEAVDSHSPPPRAGSSAQAQAVASKHAGRKRMGVSEPARARTDLQYLEFNPDVSTE